MLGGPEIGREMNLKAFVTTGLLLFVVASLAAPIAPRKNGNFGDQR